MTMDPGSAGECTLPILPAGYQYQIDYFLHARAYNYSGNTPAPLRIALDLYLDNASRISITEDMQSVFNHAQGLPLNLDMNSVGKFFSTAILTPIIIKPSFSLSAGFPAGTSTSSNLNFNVSEVHIALHIHILKSSNQVNVVAAKPFGN
jgi:hypothetical protein